MTPDDLRKVTGHLGITGEDVTRTLSREEGEALADLWEAAEWLVEIDDALTGVAITSLKKGGTRSVEAVPEQHRRSFCELRFLQNDAYLDLRRALKALEE